MALTAEQERLLDEQESSNMGPLDYLSDWAQSALGGPRRGLESIPGSGGDIYNAMATVASVIARATPEEQDRMYQELAAQRRLPSSAETEAATEPYLGKHYQPKTRIGRILNLIGASVTGGGGRHFLRDVVAPSVGGEIGGEIGETYGGPFGELVGTLAGGGAGGSLQEAAKRRLLRPATPERIEQINTLRDEGVELTGGQATGSEPLQYMEAGPFAGKAEGIARQQAQQYTRAVMRKAGLDSDRADAATLSRAQQDFSNEYEAMIAANNGIVMDPQLQQELIDHGSRYEDLKGTSKDAVGKTFNRILDASSRNGGVIPPDVFQQINGEISATLKAARNSPELSALSDTLREFRDSMYASMERANPDSGVPERARDLNNRYRNFKIIEKSMRGQGQDTMYGFITPGNLATAVKQSESITDWSQSRGDFDDLAKAGGLTAPIKNSGTAGRGLVAGMGTGLAAAGGMLLSGQPLAAAGTAATALAAPFAATIPGQVLTARPVRTSIVRRATGEVPTETVGIPGTRFTLQSDSMFTPLPIQALTPAMIGAGSRDLAPATEPPVPVEPPPDEGPDEQSMLLDQDLMPAPVDFESFASRAPVAQPRAPEPQRLADLPLQDLGHLFASRLDRRPQDFRRV